jgi:SNF2 family DNA or RNA helicase
MTSASKTVEAGLVLREMLLRRRVDYIVISSPAAMTAQWQDELAQKFGLEFTIIDRDYLAAVRRNYGFSANPWAVCREDHRGAPGGHKPRQRRKRDPT